MTSGLHSIPNDRPVLVDGRSLTRFDLERVAFDDVEVRVAGHAWPNVDLAASFVDELVDRGDVVYGVTTGFGKNADVLLPDKASAISLQESLIISHAVGVGPPLEIPLVRAILTVRINTLLRGHSGVRRSTVEGLVNLLNRHVIPVVPEKGSCGASGDLAPGSHIALVLLGRGEAFYDGKRLNGGDALKAAGLEPLKLTYKEGLALTNSTAFMTAFGALSLSRLERAIVVADIGACLTLEAICGRSAAFDPRIHELRGHPGQIATAENIRRVTQHSTLIDIDPAFICRNGGDWVWSDARQAFEGAKSRSPQDAYSVRCSPPVHGATRDVLSNVTGIIGRELDAVTDNPILFPADGDAISAGNFHGQPIALALSQIKVGIPPIAAICERRIAKLVDPATSDGLPAFLVDNRDGIQSGFMMVQYSAASLVNELATRVHPATAYSIPTCANVEDHVSMGANEARHVLAMLDDLERVLGLELLVAAQAVDARLKILRGEWWDQPEESRGAGVWASNRAASFEPGVGSRAAIQCIRDRIPFLERDRELRLDIDAAIDLVRTGSIRRAVEDAIGPMA